MFSSVSTGLGTIVNQSVYYKGSNCPKKGVLMKKLFKKTAVLFLVFGIFLSVSTTAFARGSSNEPGPGWDPPAPWSGPDGN